MGHTNPNVSEGGAGTPTRNVSEGGAGAPTRNVSEGGGEGLRKIGFTLTKTKPTNNLIL